jgi:hypothetical protein
MVSLCTGALAPVAAVAAEWSLAPTVNWVMDHDSNRRLSADGSEGQGAFLQFDALMQRATARTSLGLRPQIELQRYSNDSASDSDNQRLLAFGSWRDERTQIDAYAQYADESTLVTELTETGIIDGDTQRELMSAGADWSRQISANHQLSARVAYQDIGYRGDDVSLLSGYRYASAALTERARLSPRTAVSLSIFSSRLRPGSFGESSREAGLSIAMDREISSRLASRVSVGYSERATAAGDDSGYVGELELTRRGVLGDWRLFATRSMSPSGRGLLVLRTSAGLAFERALSARWGVSVDAQGVRNEDVGENISGERYSYSGITTGLEWQGSRTWRLGFETGFNVAQDRSGSESHQGWRAAVRFVWTPRRFSISR